MVEIELKINAPLLITVLLVYCGFNTSLKNSACHQLDLIFSRGNILHKKTTWVNDGSGKKDLRSWKTLPLELLHSYLMHIWTSFIRYHPNIINPIYIIWPNCILISKQRITPLLLFSRKLFSVNNIWSLKFTCHWDFGDFLTTLKNKSIWISEKMVEISKVFKSRVT